MPPRDEPWNVGLITAKDLEDIRFVSGVQMGQVVLGGGYWWDYVHGKKDIDPILANLLLIIRDVPDAGWYLCRRYDEIVRSRLKAE